MVRLHGRLNGGKQRTPHLRLRAPLRVFGGLLCGCSAGSPRRASVHRRCQLTARFFSQLARDCDEDEPDGSGR